MKYTKLNNKGFTTSIILFGLLILFLAVVSALLFTMDNSYTLNNTLKKNLLASLEYDYKKYEYLKHMDGIDWYFDYTNLEEDSSVWVNQIGDENFNIYNSTQIAEDGALVLSGSETSYGKLSIENLDQLTLYMVVRSSEDGDSDFITTGSGEDASNMIRINGKEGYLSYANDNGAYKYSSTVNASNYNVYVVSYDTVNNKSILYIDGVKAFETTAGLFDGNYYLGNYGTNYKTGDNNYYMIAIANKIHTENEILENMNLLMRKYDIDALIESKTYTFEYTDANPQIFVAPTTASYKLEVWGAQGGYRTNPENSGKGGYSTGTIKLQKGEELYIYVGSSGNTSGASGGYNGGGSRVSQPGGGGATDMRLFKEAPTEEDLQWDSSKGLLSRIIVAGGGGSDGADNRIGGSGGGTSGITATNGYGSGGEGATSTTAGLRGSFGKGGNGLNDSSNNGQGGAGGGGWYGGGGVTPDGGGDDDLGGGGGSGFILTKTFIKNAPEGYSFDSRYYLTKALTIAGNASMPTHDGASTMTGNSGDGYAKITLTSPLEPVNRKGFIVGSEFAFEYTGGYQKFIAKKAGKYKLEVWGAQGGYRTSTSDEGKGGYSTGIIDLQKDEAVYIYVGESGNSGGNAGGYNGGGSRELYSGGGGATDIRLFSETPTTEDLQWDSSTGLLSRIIVAGGGGSDGGENKGGGAGGGISGISATNGYGSGADGATSTSAGTGGIFGKGGNGKSENGGHGGAGGGGWYGGGGTTPDPSADDDKGGGGGSGFVLTSTTITNVPEDYSFDTKYYLKNAYTIPGNESIPTYDGASSMIGNEGDGYAKITYLGDNDGYVSNGLIVRYDSTSLGNSANKLLDLSGNGNDGTIFGATFNNNSLQFDGNDYVNIGLLDIQSNITIEATFSSDEILTNNVTLISNYESGGAGIQISNGIIKSDVYVNSAYNTLYDSSVHQINQKYNVTITYDGTDMKMYVDNVLVSSSNPNGNISHPSSTIFMIGSNPNGTSPAGEYFIGKLYSIRIYNTALSEEEINTNYQRDHEKYY